MRKDYEAILKYIRTFFVCYMIIGRERSNKLEDLVFKYAPMFEDNFSDNLLEEFSENLKGKIPDFEWFLNSFKNIGYSRHFDLYKDDKEKKRVQVILEIIEQFDSGREDIGEYTIEHIWPDSLNIENSKIGNLVPLEENLNQRLGDEINLEDKFKIYEQSSFKSTRGLEEAYKDRKFSPEQRTEYLAKLIYDDILKLK